MTQNDTVVAPKSRKRCVTFNKTVEVLIYPITENNSTDRGTSVRMMYLALGATLNGSVRMKRRSTNSTDNGSQNHGKKLAYEQSPDKNTQGSSKGGNTQVPQDDIGVQAGQQAGDCGGSPPNEKPQEPQNANGMQMTQNSVQPVQQKEQGPLQKPSLSSRVMYLALGTVVLCACSIGCYSKTYMPDAEILLPSLNVSLEYSDLAAGFMVGCIVVALAIWCYCGIEKHKSQLTESTTTKLHGAETESCIDESKEK